MISCLSLNLFILTINEFSPTLFIHFVWGKLGEFGSGYLGGT